MLFNLLVFCVVVLVESVLFNLLVFCVVVLVESVLFNLSVFCVVVFFFACLRSVSSTQCCPCLLTDPPAFSNIHLH